MSNTSLKPIPLSVISPPFHNYVGYHGSLPVPPCTESVLWIVRSQALPVNRVSILTIDQSTRMVSDARIKTNIITKQEPQKRNHCIKFPRPRLKTLYNKTVRPIIPSGYTLCIGSKTLVFSPLQYNAPIWHQLSRVNIFSLQEFLEAVNLAMNLEGEPKKLLGRSVQSLHDRKVYLFGR